MIQNTLSPGEKIPSVRRMHRETGASIGSVLQAYHLLESRGVIEVKPQSGFYVPLRSADIASIPEHRRPSTFKEEVDQYVIQAFVRATTDRNVVQLAEATPDPDLLP